MIDAHLTEMAMNCKTGSEGNAVTMACAAQHTKQHSTNAMHP